MPTYTRAIVANIHRSGDIDVVWSDADGDHLVEQVPVLCGYGPVLRETVAVLDIQGAPLALGAVYGPTPDSD